MAQYPIKMLKDENGTPFVPLVAPEAVKDNQGTDWQALIDKKLEKTNIIAGDNITLSVSGNDITINSQASGASDYTALSNKPSLDTTSGVSLNPLKEEINGEISLHKIAKTGNYEDLLYKPIIPITFTDNMESDYSISKLPGWQVDLLQKMIDEYVKDNKSINNYILKADGIMFLENYAIGDLNNKYSTEGKNTRLYTFKKCGPYGSIPQAFQFVGPTSLSYNIYPESGYGVINISNKGILIYCDNNYRVTEVCQRYKLYDEAEKNTSVSIEVVPTNLSSATAFIATEDHQPATKKYVDDSVGGIHIPTKTSQLQNDSDFVIKTTNELTNYYTKNNTYTKNEVDALVAGGKGHVIENMLDVVIYRLSNLDNKSEFRFFGPSNSGVIALGLSFENVSLTSGDKFEMSATFQTASSECTFVITESTSVKVKLTGDDVTNGVLNPVANKVYEIAFYWNGFFMSGVVRGVEHRSSK